MSFRDSEYMKLKAETQDAVNTLITKRNEEQEAKLRIESVIPECYHDPPVDKVLELIRLAASEDHVKNASKIAHERAIDMTVKLSKTIDERTKEPNVSEAEAGAEMAFVERLCDAVWGKPQPPPPQ